MARTTRSPELLALQRRKLDGRLRTDLILTPEAGWIRTIRDALGMSASQLGRRLGMSSQGALDLERRERAGSITVAKLREAARALDCEVHLILVPVTSLEETARRQATAKARAERNEALAEMHTNAPDGDDEKALKKRARKAWLTTRLARLWD